MRKVNILLQAIDRLGKDVEYYAVDLSLPELERTFSQIPIGKCIRYLHAIRVAANYVPFRHEIMIHALKPPDWTISR